MPARCVSCQSTTACSISTTVTRSTRGHRPARRHGEADAEPADQHVVRRRVSLQCGVDEQAFGLSLAGVHQERAVADDLEVVADPAKHELTTLGDYPGETSAGPDMRGPVSGGSDARSRGRARGDRQRRPRNSTGSVQGERRGHVEGHLAAARGLAAGLVSSAYPPENSSGGSTIATPSARVRNVRRDERQPTRKVAVNPVRDVHRAPGLRRRRDRRRGSRARSAEPGQPRSGERQAGAHPIGQVRGADAGGVSVAVRPAAEDRDGRRGQGLVRMCRRASVDRAQGRELAASPSSSWRRPCRLSRCLAGSGSLITSGATVSEMPSTTCGTNTNEMPVSPGGLAPTELPVALAARGLVVRRERGPGRDRHAPTVSGREQVTRRKTRGPTGSPDPRSRPASRSTWALSAHGRDFWRGFRVPYLQVIRSTAPCAGVAAAARAT